MSVEAVPEYFDRIVKRPKNAYVNAVCSVDSSEPIQFHDVPADTITRHGLLFWLRGCGSISIETQPSLQAHREFVQSQELPRVVVRDLVAHGLFTDPLAYDTMQRFYDAIDLLVCTSSSEGGPLPVFEAMACGVPVISTDVGLVKECRSVPKFSTVEEAVAIIESLRNDPAKLEACREAQREEFEGRMSMERLLPHWERFFDACRGPAPSALMF